MHEVSLCESVLKILEKQLEKEKFTRILRVNLILGDLSGASAEAMAFAFPMVVKGTFADGATLTFTQTPDNALRVGSIEVE